MLKMSLSVRSDLMFSFQLHHLTQNKISLHSRSDVSWSSTLIWFLQQQKYVDCFVLLVYSSFSWCIPPSLVYSSFSWCIPPSLVYSSFSWCIPPSLGVFLLPPSLGVFLLLLVSLWESFTMVIRMHFTPYILYFNKLSYIQNQLK